MITAEYLRRITDYDQETGLLRWKIGRRGRLLNGQVGDRTAGGYLRVGISYRRYLVHRLAWLYVTGAWPKDQLDHINGDRADNRFANLREATAAQNRANMRMRSSNRLGIKGVRRRADCRKWEARICKNYQEISIGCFTSPELAHAAYMAKARELFGEFARVR